MSFKTEAPPGYTFIAAGDPKLTSKCKELSRTQGLVVYIVSVSLTGPWNSTFELTIQKTSRVNSLSEQVGRLGYHFPSTVVEQACQVLGSTIAKSGNVHYQRKPGHHPYATRSKRSIPQQQGKRKQNAKPRAASVGNEMDQSDIDARAAFAIRDLFPKIPDNDVQHIVAQAFQKV